MNAVAIEVRDLRFAVDDARVPRVWHPAGRSVTTFFDNLSLFFPVGERFFIASVRAHGRHVESDALARAVNAFCAQEGMHGREHDRYNAMVRARYASASELEGRVGALLKEVTRRVPKRLRLGATCALEHFTALMGKSILEDARMLDGADDAMAALWRWHAAEENEHKSVAFDVFVASGGTYAERALSMIGASVIFWAKVLEHQARMMRDDGTALSAREWGKLAWFLFGEPGGMRGVVRDYFAYYRPSFHPSDIESAGAIDAWRAGYGANARLATNAPKRPAAKQPANVTATFAAAAANARSWRRRVVS